MSTSAQAAVPHANDLDHGPPRERPAVSDLDAVLVHIAARPAVVDIVILVLTTGRSGRPTPT
ncbi:hypothetical protein [Umezawaea sp. Da 62-37]|uniref:hypothetical protein n=1 Tax=Umezawaea sp. Da 62-37 TaxID=3075927 RepID=UPI0028F6EAB3|nr:hypothetical protein [Umezawaea sp. Da 62-37]WNV85449.1 hypothetical protein RM788_46250 [Umezawaea sp. Da 62-37]